MHSNYELCKGVREGLFSDLFGLAIVGESSVFSYFICGNNAFCPQLNGVANTLPDSFRSTNIPQPKNTVLTGYYNHVSMSLNTQKAEGRGGVSSWVSTIRASKLLYDVVIF